MKETTVNNLNTLEKITFFNDLSPEENLISAYISVNNLNSQLLNRGLRDELKNKIELCNDRTLHLDGLSTFNHSH